MLGVAATWNKRKGLEVFVRLANELSGDYLLIMVGVNERNKEYASWKHCGDWKDWQPGGIT